MALQRLFSTFPGRWPGLGLFLLRLVVGSTAFASGAGNFANPRTPISGVWLAGALEILLGVLLVIGFFTPIASIVTALAGIFFEIGALPKPTSLLCGRSEGIDAIAVALALAVLGAGAFSLDAYLFGRREIIIPDIPRSPKL